MINSLTDNVVNVDDKGNDNGDFIIGDLRKMWSMFNGRWYNE